MVKATLFCVTQVFLQLRSKAESHSPLTRQVCTDFDVAQIDQVKLIHWIQWTSLDPIQMCKMIDQNDPLHHFCNLEVCDTAQQKQNS